MKIPDVYFEEYKAGRDGCLSLNKSMYGFVQEEVQFYSQYS